MSTRKEHVIVMKKYLGMFESQQESRFDIPEEDTLIIIELIILDYLNKDAFINLDTFNTKNSYSFLMKYPLTPKGKEYLEQGWYKRLRECNAYQVVRDFVAFMGFIAGLILGVMQFLKK